MPVLQSIVRDLVGKNLLRKSSSQDMSHQDLDPQIQQATSVASAALLQS